MSAGARRTRLRLERPNIAQDELGASLLTLELVDSVWAEMAPLSVERGVAFDRRSAASRYRVKLLMRADVRAGWRFVLGSRVFLIETRQDADAHLRHLILEVREEFV